jgi:cell division protease FtsH
MRKKRWAKLLTFFKLKRWKKIVVLSLAAASTLLYGKYVYIPCNEHPHKDEIEWVAYADFYKMVEAEEIDTVYMQNNISSIYYYKKDDKNTIYQTNNPEYDTFKSELLTHSAIILPIGDLQFADSIESSREATITIIALGLGSSAAMCLAVDVFRYKTENIENTDSVINTHKKKKATAGPNGSSSSASVETSGGEGKTFNDIAGLKEVKRDMKCLVDFLVNKEKYTAAGAKLPKGVILYGPPGTGKTLLAKAIAGEADVPFIFMSGSDFIETYVGTGAKRVRELFATARKQAPCIVFIDEIDAVGGKRHDGDNGEDRKTINAILTEMDGFNESENILVIAATNRLEDLDDALTRPGRFTDQFCVPLPETTAERMEIIKLYSKNKKLSEDIDIKAVAKEMIGFSPAKIEAVLNEAAIISVQENSPRITKEIIDKAMFKMLLHGHAKEDAERSKEELSLVAWHEAGHALIGHLYGKDITKVTIISSTSGAGGVTFSAPKKTGLHSIEDIKHEIMELYAGRIGELLYYKGNHLKVTTGASNDIERATGLIHHFVTSYGMSDTFGMLKLDGDIIDKKQVMQIKVDLAKELEQETLRVMTAYQEELQDIADALIQKETIYKADLKEIISQRPDAAQKKNKVLNNEK